MRILTEEATKFQSKNVVEKKVIKCTESVVRELLLIQIQIKAFREHKLCDDTG